MTARLRFVRRTALSVVVLSAVLLAQSPQQLAPPPDLDQWVARAMTTFEVPGVALAIVRNDAVVVAKGYGVRKLGEPAPVDARTLFGIASNTKAFTATARPAGRRTENRMGRPRHSVSAGVRNVSPATDFSYDFQDLLLKPVR